MTRLHIFLGDGGVGKTTLAAAYAIGLAGRSKKVGLMSIDPARRLQTALGLALAEQEVRVPCRGELYAALLVPEATLRRWATDSLADDQARRLLHNRFFRVIADRLGATTDVIAAVRIAEWLERDSSLTDLVIDTAPGRSGIEFLLRPGALVALAQGRLVRWLRRLAGTGHATDGEPHGLAARVLRGLGQMAGMEMLVELAELASVIEKPFTHVLARLELAEALVHQPTTRVLLVMSIREDGVAGARALGSALRQADMSPSAVLINQMMPESLSHELDAVEEKSLTSEGAAIRRYVRAYVEIQSQIVTGAAALAPRVIRVPAVSGLDSDRRKEELGNLGQRLCDALEGATGNTAPVSTDPG